MTVLVLRSVLDLKNLTQPIRCEMCGHVCLPALNIGHVHVLRVLNNIHELDCDWLRAVQFKCNISAKGVTPVKITHRINSVL